MRVTTIMAVTTHSMTELPSANKWAFGKFHAMPWFCMILAPSMFLGIVRTLTFGLAL
ncbi:uncharacterized protein BCR38DRAFT_446888 [Pseudomassariella vexata]|uniref:Uncharacterized protein n=1 Tax=Pseudomassariella vexata TaxID=1141098 RepID=A0A1Y2DI25_9PEZI|nr:uncharacterized protein BCR38DRAFT_446888 [Pseudomassariella vexata]ORY58881.1 hypothetical protein BCR38DRAFT_446888 [Pseudomassariella vexata]